MSQLVRKTKPQSPGHPAEWARIAPGAPVHVLKPGLGGGDLEGLLRSGVSGLLNVGALVIRIRFWDILYKTGAPGGAHLPCLTRSNRL